MPTGFKEAKRAVIAALRAGTFQHEARNEIDVKNLLQTGGVSAQFVEGIILRCKGTEHTCTPHHQVSAIDVHTIISQGWYVKFYFLDPDTWFISVHETAKKRKP